MRIESINKDHPHSWVRISHGLKKLVTDLSNKEHDDNEQETSEMQFEEFALKTNVLAFASRSQTEAKPQRRTSACSSTRTVPICERSWTDIEPETYSLIAYPVSKQLSALLRHGHLPREEDGAIEFWRFKDFLRNEFEYSQHLSDDVWKSKMVGGGGNKERFQHCTDPSGTILYHRALQGHSGRNSIDPSLQDNELVPNNFFEYISHIGCAINLHSILNSGLIQGGQNLSKRQTVFFLPVDPMNEEHKDPEKVDLKAPRLARYLQTAWKKHQNTVYWVDIRLAQKKGLEFHQTRSNAIILYNTLPAYCIPKAIKMERGEIKYEKVYESPRPPPKISFLHKWRKELGSGHTESSQPTQPKTPNPTVRTGRPVTTEQTSRSSAQEIDTRFLLGCESTNVSVECSDKGKDADENVNANRVRTVRPVGSEQSIDLFTQREEIDIDFMVSGLPHAVVKQAENFRVRELVKKIESHPHRQALQADLQQSNAYNQFSEKSKKMIRDMGNVELFATSAMLRMPSLLESRNSLLHFWTSLERK